LYDSVREPNRTTLAKGFTKQLADHYANQENGDEFQWDDAAREEADQILPRLMRLL
jgi:hypothetical protein